MKKNESHIISANSLNELIKICSEYKTVGIVGKMASGKNFVSSKMEQSGWKSIDADLLVHKAIEQATPQIYETFHKPAEQMGLNILNADNSINRRELGKLLFSNADLLAKQEAIVYPVITKMVEDFIEQNEKTIINATVLYKTPELLKLCDSIIYVKASVIKRFFRARKRDRLPYKQIFKRFISQKNLFQQYLRTGTQIILIKN